MFIEIASVELQGWQIRLRTKRRKLVKASKIGEQTWEEKKGVKKIRERKE